MDWQAGAVIAAAIAALGGIELRLRRESRTEQVRWLRDQRIARYSMFMQAFDTHMDAIHYTLAEHLDEEIPPDPLPSVGSTHQQLRDRFSDLCLVAPPEVTQLARQMTWAADDHNSSIGPYGDTYYRHWDKVHSLRDQYIRACIDTLASSEIGMGAAQDRAEWRRAWIA